MDMAKPKIRFKGYTDDWEQRKLEDYIVEYHEVTTESNQYPALTSSRKGIFLQTEYFAGNQIASEDNTGYNVVPYGYFTYRHMSDDEIFHFNINDIVENGIVSTLYPVFTTTEELDSRYLQYQLNHGHEFARFAVLQKQGGSRTYMYLSKLKQLSLTMPKTVDEQKQISGFFMELDHLITLHQCKCYLLLKLLHNDWEQRKLGDVFKEYSEKHHEELPALTIIQGGGTILRKESDRNLQYDKSNLSGYKMVHKDDFIVHLRSFEGGLEKANSDGIISPAYHTLHGDSVDSRFYYPYFRSYDFINRKLVAHVYGIRDGRSIDIEGMKNIEIPYTSYEEQKKIGDYLDNLDNIITLHHRKYTDTLKAS